MNTQCAIANVVISEFEHHAERLRLSASERRQACQLKNCVDDKTNSANAKAGEALGLRLPSDKFEGCVNLRTLRCLLKKIDEAGWER